jgi:hypothetical protein
MRDAGDINVVIGPVRTAPASVEGPAQAAHMRHGGITGLRKAIEDEFGFAQLGHF